MISVFKEIILIYTPLAPATQGSQSILQTLMNLTNLLRAQKLHFVESKAKTVREGC